MRFIEYFDDRMLNSLHSITQFTIAVIFLLIYSVYKKKYLNKITLGFVLHSLGLFLITLRDTIPDFTSIFLGNVLLIFSLFLIYDAMVNMVGLKGYYKLYVILSVMFAIIHFIFQYLSPSLSLRIINYSVFTILGTLYLIIQFIMSSLKKLNTVVFIVILTHTVYIVILIMRIIYALQAPNLSHLFSNTSILKVFILYSIFLSIIRVVCIIMYNMKDLVHSD